MNRFKKFMKRNNVFSVMFTCTIFSITIFLLIKNNVVFELINMVKHSNRTIKIIIFFVITILILMILFFIMLKYKTILFYCFKDKKLNIVDKLILISAVTLIFLEILIFCYYSKVNVSIIIIFFMVTIIGLIRKIIIKNNKNGKRSYLLKDVYSNDFEYDNLSTL